MSLIDVFFMQSSAIPFYPMVAKEFGLKPKATLLFGLIERRGAKFGAWVELRIDAVVRDTGMSRHELDTARKSLISKRLVDYKLMGVPPTGWYLLLSGGDQ